MSESVKKGGAPAGNKYGLKLKDPETRQEAYRSYCDHIAKGNSKESWYFEHEECGGGITWETMESYMKDDKEFSTGQIKVAKAKSFGHWEGVLHDLADGRNKDANPAAIQMIMRNKFGWDRPNAQVQQAPFEIMHSQELIMLQLEDVQQKYRISRTTISDKSQNTDTSLEDSSAESPDETVQDPVVQECQEFPMQQEEPE